MGAGAWLLTGLDGLNELFSDVLALRALDLGSPVLAPPSLGPRAPDWKNCCSICSCAELPPDPPKNVQQLTVTLSPLRRYLRFSVGLRYSESFQEFYLCNIETVP